MKKTAKALLIVFVIFNLIFSLSGINNVKAFSSEGDFNEWDKDGTVNATVDNSEKSISVQISPSISAATIGNLAEILMFLPSVVSSVMSATVNDKYILQALAEGVGETASKGISVTTFNIIDIQVRITDKFTIQALVQGAYEIFDINFLDLSDLEENNMEADGFNDVLKLSVAKYYYIIRNVSLIISVFALIYIGIRMAVSTMAEQKAKYKKLLIAWILSVIMIFMMHYIIIIALELSEWILKMIMQFGTQLEANLGINPDFESNVINRVQTNYSKAKGFATIPSIILYWSLVYYQLKFFMLYTLRTLEVAMLIIISPLVTVTYSIDSAGDGKSQAFNAWFKEIMEKIFLQDLHCLAYYIFLITASAIAEKAPALALLFFASLSRVEKLVKTLFKMRGKGIRDMKVPFFNK